MVSPFKTGNGIVLRSTIYTPPPGPWAWYLDSSPTAGKSTSVYLSSNRDFKTHPGCYWEITTIGQSKLRLKTIATGSDRRYLDSSGAASRADSVYLKNQTAGGGSYWLVTWSEDYNGYTFKCDTPSGTKRYLCADPLGSKEESVFLYLEGTPTPYATNWQILFTHCTGESVQSIICAVYPSISVSSCELNATYGSLKYDHLHSIWKDTQLGVNQITPHANDLTVCLKAEVYKHSYNSDFPLAK